MKKTVITIALVIAAGLVGFVGYGFYKASGLTTIHLVNSVTVKGSKEEVYDMVRYLKNFPKWSPFLAEDPEQKYEVRGTDGAVGAQYHWDGNKGEDLGYQEIVKVTPMSYVGMKCDIQKPFVAHPTFEYYFTETVNGVEVKQEFKLVSGMGDAFFMWLFGAKAGMEKTNRKGLELLKKAVEGKK
jgi:hypothetical protein